MQGKAAKKNSAHATSSQVSIVGRLGAHLRTRELPSGDVITAFTVVVDRPAGKRKTVSVDSLACITDRARARAALARMEPGTMVCVEGTLRRRFWRGASAGALGSAMEVLVRSVRKV